VLNIVVCVRQVQLTTLCVSVTLSATVALVCLFGPKLHIIAFQSHKNVRKLTMTTAASGQAGAGPGPGPGPGDRNRSLTSQPSTDTAPPAATAAAAGGTGSTGRVLSYGTGDSQRRPSGRSRSGLFDPIPL